MTRMIIVCSVLAAVLTNGCAGVASKVNSPSLPSSASTNSDPVPTSAPAPGVTWYIRPDGGTRQQCTGTTDAAYPGSGTGQPCGFNHPFWLVTDNISSWAWIIAGGDSVIIEPATYYMGQPISGHTYPVTDSAGRPGISYTWAHCNGNWYGCSVPPPPSGISTSQPTRFLGGNHGSCHNSTGLINPPTFSGIGGVPQIFYFHLGQSYFDFECIEFTQLANCTKSGGGPAYGTCTGTGTADYAENAFKLNLGPTGGLGGTNDPGPNDLTMKDLAFNGLAANGIIGSALNQNVCCRTHTTTMDHLYFWGNGASGWNTDSGGCASGSTLATTVCFSYGTISLTNSDFDWNGCITVKPTGSAPGQYPSSGFDHCTDQNSAGFGTALSAIGCNSCTWIVDHDIARWNTQNGFDLLHAGDDSSPTLGGTGNPMITITNSYAEGNEGEGFKAGTSNLTIRNNILIANCARLHFTFSPNPTGWNTYNTQECRTNDAWNIHFGDGYSGVFEFNTTVTYTDVIYDFACNVAGPCSGNYPFTFRNNLHVGTGVSYHDSGTNASTFFYGCASYNAATFVLNYPCSFSAPGTLPLNSNSYQSFSPGQTDLWSQAGSAIDHNLWWNMRLCPYTSTASGGTSPYETSSSCSDPLVFNESNFSSGTQLYQTDNNSNLMNPLLTSGSPAIGAGLAVSGVTTDYAGTTRPNPPAIGSLQ